MKTLITGGTGFVGANLTRRLLNEGEEVHLILRSESNTWRLIDVIEQTHCQQVELGNLAQVQEVFHKEHFDNVYHLAAHGAYSFQKDLKQIIDTNLVALSNLLIAADQSNVKLFVNTGSSSEYGDKDHAPLEDESSVPNSYYSATKLAATHLVKEFAKTSSMNLLTYRLYSVYGPYEEKSRLIPQLLLHAIENKTPPLANPKTVRDFIYVEDVVDAFLLAHKNQEPGGIYNIGTGHEVQLEALVMLIKELFGVKVEPQWGDYANRTWDTQVWQANPDKAEYLLGWVPKTSLAEGLKRTMEWISKTKSYPSFD
jgi:nucleoside-diphosphate-sugar epimerase